ncbi:uncharacterized protein SPSC_01089 [Sporisorium scitamineum]|uniref:Uncharacterized protein n=1 Tax=Sporisorium scitamineum TaxID=49012 RepID=A0A0F7RVR8_9BASI|nr:hypothetical protein [Sporisorium scitamineum]CDU22459.1 uncharacterized protein SPSC_01089 [Sporisorium scitamineum]
MTMMDGDDMQRLWSLIEDLTNQLQANRQLCESLQQQADQLRGQAIHSGTGFALRRFNTDLSKEKFESELEALNAHLVKENLALSQENKQQAVLLREYENTLETVMAKFRSFSHSTQQHTLQLTQHYESLLAQTTHNAAEQTLAAETAFSGTLTHLGGLVRRAMQSLDGQVSDESDDEDHDGVSSQRKPKRGWVQDPKWYGSGGYTGKTTDPVALRADEALEQLTEEERLRMENDTLRELLGLKEKSDALISSATGVMDAAPLQAPDAAAPKPISQAERRASLTVDEAAIAAEASGQPPYKALQVSTTTRSGEEGLDNKALSPSSRASPKITPVLDRKDQIIEEAILADDENETERGRRASDPNILAGIDGTAAQTEPLKPSATALLPQVFAADDAETAPSSIEELRATTPPTEPAPQAHTTSPTQAGSGEAAIAPDADEITPIDKVDLPTSAEPAATAGPNMLAEAAPPALVSTGIEEGDAIASKTTVTSASGIDVTETASPPFPAPTATISGPEELTSTNETSASSSVGVDKEASPKPADVSSSVDEAAPPADSAEGDFQPISAASTAAPSDEFSETKVEDTVLPAEPAKQDNTDVSAEAAADAQLSTDAADASASPATTAVAEEKDTPQEVAESTATSEDATAGPNKNARTTPSQPNQGNKNGSATPGKKGGRGHRGKGNQHNKSNSNASNKGSS